MKPRANIVIPASNGKNIYFLSDFHLGAPNYEASLVREKKIVKFLSSIENDASHIFLLGDMFDFWFEYKNVVPRGFVRLLGKLASMSDAGINFHFFVGNHDMWMNNYLQQEMNFTVYFEPAVFRIGDKSFFIGHGDGLGPGDKGYKMLKKLFRNRLCQTAFGSLHPWLGLGIANYFSRKSREKTGSSDQVFLGEENEWLAIYAKQKLRDAHYDYFVFGHRHLPLDIKLNDNSRYVNLGDWITNFTYARFNGEQLELKQWE